MYGKKVLYLWETAEINNTMLSEWIRKKDRFLLEFTNTSGDTFFFSVCIRFH